MELQGDVWHGDALCFVLANNRLADTVLKVLEKFLPNHNPIVEDYEDYGQEYDTEAAMLLYFQMHPHLHATRHWNEVEITNHRVMVGAYFTTDGQLIISLTVEGNGEIEGKLFAELKQILHSETGLISYNFFPKFKEGAGFKALCESL